MRLTLITQTKTTQRHGLLTTLFISFLFMIPLAATSYSETYQWPAVEGANYYQGIAQSGTVKYYFRTSATNIKLDNVQYMTLYAYKENGAIIPTAIKIKKVGKKTKLTPEKELEEPLSPDEIALLELEKENSTAFMVAPYRDISLELSIGEENLSATGGISQFSGKSNIGGTSIRLEIDFAKEDGNPWALILYGRGHNFTTNIDSGSSGATTEETQLTLFHFDALGQFRFYQTSQLSLNVSAGVSYVEIPAMQLKGDSSGEAILAADSFSGISLALLSSWGYSSSSSLHFHISSMVSSFGQNKPTNSANTELKWKTLVVPQIYATVGLRQQIDSYEKDLACSSSISNCYSTAKSKSQQSMLQLGAQMSF